MQISSITKGSVVVIAYISKITSKFETGVVKIIFNFDASKVMKLTRNFIRNWRFISIKHSAKYFSKVIKRLAHVNITTPVIWTAFVLLGMPGDKRDFKND